MDNRMSLLTSPFVPDGMVDLMKKLSKGVIKDRPSNIHEYAADFFEKMLIERDGGLDKGYGKFRSYTEYCKFMDKMDQRRLNRIASKEEITNNTNDAVVAQEEVEASVPPANIEVQGVAIQGVERKSKDSVKNVSINPKYKSQSEKVTKPIVSSVKKTKPRKLSSKKPSENLIVIKEETSADVDDSGNGEFKLNKAATTIQKAFRTYLDKKNNQGEHFSHAPGNVSQLSEDAAALIIQRAFKCLIQKMKPSGRNGESNNNIVIPAAGQEHDLSVNKMVDNSHENSEQIPNDDEYKDTNEEQQEDSFGDTVISSETEMTVTPLVTNLDNVTASDTTEMQRTEIKSEETQNDESSSSAADESHTVIVISDNTNDNSNDGDVESSQENEISIPSDEAASPAVIDAISNEIPQTVDTFQDEVELKENEAVKNGEPIDKEVQSVQMETTGSEAENLGKQEIIADDCVTAHVSDDSPVQDNSGSIEDELSTEQAPEATPQLETKSIFTTDSEIENFSKESQSEAKKGVLDDLIDKEVQSVQIDAAGSRLENLKEYEKQNEITSDDSVAAYVSDTSAEADTRIAEEQLLAEAPEATQQLEVKSNLTDGPEIQKLSKESENVPEKNGSDSPIYREPQSVQTAESKSEHLEKDENLKEVIANDSIAAHVSDNTAETTEEPISTETVPKTADQLEIKSNFTNEPEMENVSDVSEQPEITAPSKASETESSGNHAIASTSGEEILQPEIQVTANQLEQIDSEETKMNSTSIESAVSAPPETDANILDDKENTEKQSLSSDIEVMDDTEQKTTEPPVNEQLFVVDKDGIYVNMDLLQEKFGTAAIDDGTGSDSEKSFKLNILEREEILVNQENVQQVGDESLVISDVIVPDKCDESSSVKNEAIVEDVENMENNCETKDEEGNEEYELAETVVLVDIPFVSKSHRENEHQLPETPTAENESSDTMKPNLLKLPETPTAENEFSDKMKPNLLNDEAYKLESNPIDGNKLDKLSESVKIRDDPANEEVPPAMKVDDEQIVKSETHVEELQNVEDELNKNEEDHLTSNPEAVAIETHEIGEEKTKTDENIGTHADQSSELKASRFEEAVKVESVLSDEKSSNEHFVDQLNENAVAPETSNSEIAMDNGIDEVDKVDPKQDDFVEQPNKGNDAILEGTTEPVTKSENQLSEMEKEDNTQLESKTNEEVVKKIEGEVLENVVSEKIDLPMGENGSVQIESSTDQIHNIKENEELVKAATIIQKVFRGFIVRNSGNIQRKNNKDQLELSAALTIQKYVRGYLVRRHQQKFRNSDNDQVASNQAKGGGGQLENSTDDNSKIGEVAQLPAYSNRFLIPKDSFLERESFADDEDYARTCKELAATSIQKTYRGYRVRRSLKASNETDADTDDVRNEGKNEIESLGGTDQQQDENEVERLGGDDETQTENTIESLAGNDQVKTVVQEADRVISAVLDVASDVLPVETYDSDSFEDDVNEEKNVVSESPEKSLNDEKSSKVPESVLGQIVHDNIHVEGQMQQKYNQMTFQSNPINPIDEMSDSSEHPETPRVQPAQNVAKSATIESDSADSKYGEGSKSFSYEQLSSDLSDTEENKRESLKESEVDETSRDERDDLSEVENFDLSSCGEDSLEAMYYSLRKNEIMVDRMQRQVAGQREPKGDENVDSETMKVEFPERVTENLDVTMQHVFKSLESSSDYDGDKKDDDDNSSTLDLGLDDSSSVNDEKEIETSRQIKRSEETHLEEDEQSESATDEHGKDDEDSSQSPELNPHRNAEMGNIAEQSQQSDSSYNSSTRFIMKSQSVSEDMMNPIMFAMKRKQALLDQMHVRPYPLEENLSEDHDAFPEHLLTDIDIGNIQRKIFASSVSETDSDYIEPNTTSRRLVRDDFNISTALDHLSTDSDSTIVSAATKIQAGARGFLTRRRLRRSSAGGTSMSFEKRYSFGNAAIDKSLEDLIKMQEQINLDGAALKIQQQYRRYQARKKNLTKVSPIREQTTLELSGGSSIEVTDGMDDTIGIREVTLAQKKHDDNAQTMEENTGDTHPISLNVDSVETVKPVKRTPVNQRRLTLQRGDAVQRNSRPDSQDSNLKDGTQANADNQSHENLKDSETGEYTGTINSKREKKVTAYINIQSLINRGIGPRQRSMPVQIDSELMRIIPKHLRKRVKSADIAKKKNNY